MSADKDWKIRTFQLGGLLFELLGEMPDVSAEILRSSFSTATTQSFPRRALCPLGHENLSPSDVCLERRVTIPRHPRDGVGASASTASSNTPRGRLGSERRGARRLIWRHTLTLGLVVIAARIIRDRAALAAQRTRLRGRGKPVCRR